MIDNDIINEAQKIYENGTQTLPFTWLQNYISQQETQREYRKVIEVYRKLATAIYIAQRCQSANRTKRILIDDRSKIQELISIFAKNNNFWIENTDEYFSKKYGEVIAFGGEANVYFDNKSNFVIKTIDTETYDNSIIKSLERFIIHNIIFPETFINVIGFGLSKFGLFEIIVKQPYIKGEYATYEQIKDYLINFKGAKYLNGDFIIDNFLISDMKPKNAINSNNAIYIIDGYFEIHNNLGGILFLDDKPEYYDNLLKLCGKVNILKYLNKSIKATEKLRINDIYQYKNPYNNDDTYDVVITNISKGNIIYKIISTGLTNELNVFIFKSYYKKKLT